MSPLLQFPRKVGSAPAGRWDNSRPAMLAVAMLGVVGFCIISCMMCQDGWTMVYKSAWIVLDTLSLMLFCTVFRLHMQLNLRSVSLIVVMLLLQTLIMAGIMNLQGVVPGYDYSAQALLWLPYLLAPTTVSVMVGRRLGLLTALCASVFGATLFSLQTEPAQMYVYGVISLVAGMLSAILSGRVHKREQVLRAGLCTGVAVFVCVFALVALQQFGESRADMELASINGKHFETTALLAEPIVTVVANFVLAALVGGLIPALERIFSITTPISWLEWADMNHPLLRRLQMEAPGTFQHCQTVYRLAEAGAEAVGADATRAGVCALYHDIGKLKNPGFFSENIKDQANSPHRALTPEASARIIIGHVADGVALAREHGLNRRIVDVIREHHGVSTAYFFYRKATDQYKAEKEKFEDGQIDTCPDEVDISMFSYKGPIPQTRESGIVSLADAVESATRSLVNPSEDDIRGMIASVVKSRILEGQLNDCDLTLGDIEKLKESFFENICTMHHNRIAYPKQEKDADAQLQELRKQS